jgi:hypothetical protein
LGQSDDEPAEEPRSMRGPTLVWDARKAGGDMMHENGNSSR